MLFCAGALALSTSCNDDFTGMNTPSATMHTRAGEQRAESLIQQARAGDSEAYKALALCYRDGDGVKKSWCNMMFSYLIYCEKTGKEFKNIEYPSWANNNHWRAELSEKTRRMEIIDPMTGKRARANRKK